MDSVEAWAPVPDYEGMYEVSSHGRVRSLDRIISGISGKTRPTRGRVLRPGVQSAGYLQVHLYDHGRNADPLVHRLVLEVFVGPAPDGTEACHTNGNPLDNRVENLRWATRQENIDDAIRHGTHYGARTHCPQGHPYSGANVHTRSDGSRICRACARTRGQRRSQGPLPPLTCDNCGTNIPRPGRGRPPKWCSPACKTLGIRAQVHARHATHQENLR